MIVGLIGYPVVHSLSAKMHNAAFAHIGWHDWHYELWNTSHDELPARMKLLRDSEDIAGCNVTIPHKQNVIPYLDVVSEHAQAIGAVNTIYKKVLADGKIKLHGDNTDWVGWLNDLQAQGCEPKPNDRTIVLGAGGSARAIVYALLRVGCAVTIINRKVARADGLANEMRVIFRQPLVHFAQDLQSVDFLEQIALVVNCTSAGMSPNDDTSPWDETIAYPPKAVFYDLVYKPRVTRMMTFASRAHAQVIGGIGMLVEQGAVAFEKWTGVAPSRVSHVMGDAIEAYAKREY
jgi:shikimate dehydrogenase